jgi:hypothetical protein
MLSRRIIMTNPVERKQLYMTVYLLIPYNNGRLCKEIGAGNRGP